MGFWYMVTYSLIIVFTLVGVAGWAKGAQWSWVRPFADVRRERYFAYVYRLLHSPSFESGVLKREYEEKKLKAQGLSLKPWQVAQRRGRGLRGGQWGHVCSEVTRARVESHWVVPLRRLILFPCGWQALSAGQVQPFLLKDRMMLELRIEQAIQKERSYKAQAKEIFRSLTGEDRDAFYFREFRTCDTFSDMLLRAAPVARLLRC